MGQVQILMIRHGKTPGNLQGRYVGRTDEGLCGRGRKELQQVKADWALQAGSAGRGERPLPDPAKAAGLYASPMKRCLESAGILFPGRKARILPGMQECDFGDFEYHNYRELEGDPCYQAWIDSKGKLPFPGGEDPRSFRARVCAAFEQMAEDILEKEITKAEAGAGTGVPPLYALVCHGGCIMAIMERYGQPRRGYYDWQIGNGAWIRLSMDPWAWSQGEKVLRVIETVL